MKASIVSGTDPDGMADASEQGERRPLGQDRRDQGIGPFHLTGLDPDGEALTQLSRFSSAHVFLGFPNHHMYGFSPGSRASS